MGASSHMGSGGGRYPNTPGHRGNVDTSIAAAESVAAHCPRMHRLILAALHAAGEHGMTGDELGDALGIERWSIRPRTSELKTLGWIRDSGQRRENAKTGIKAIVWQFVPEDQRPADGQAEPTRPTQSQAA